MIAIPNIGKPQNCAECPISALSEFGGFVCKLNRNNDKNNCPLIEITPCKECIYNTDNTDGDNRGWCYKHGIDIIGFCSEGER